MQRKTKAQIAYVGFLAIIFGSCAYMAASGQDDQRRLDEALNPVPSELRADIRKLAYNNKCDMLRADLLVPCNKARQVMTNSSFLLER